MDIAEEVAQAQDAPRVTYIPCTPAGTMLGHLSRNTEAGAWEALLKDAAHMPYRGKAGFQQRGYTVERAVPAAPKGKQ